MTRASEPTLSDLMTAIVGLDTRLSGIESEFSEFGEQLDTFEGEVSKRFDTIESEVGKKFDAIESEVSKRFDSIENEFGNRFDSIENEFGNRLDQIDGELAGGRLFNIERRLGNIETTLVDLQEEVTAGFKAADKDSVRLLDHERRIARLEKAK